MGYVRGVRLESTREFRAWIEGLADVGPGYRVYYSLHGSGRLVLLAGWGQEHSGQRYQEGDGVESPVSRGVDMAIPSKKAIEELGLLPYDVIDYLQTPEDRAGYLDVWLEEYPEDIRGLSRAIGDIARAKGMTEVAAAAGLNRESLYRALSEKGNPSLATVMKVLIALGIRLRAEVVSPESTDSPTNK